MQWALAHTYGWTIDLSSITGRPHLVHMLVEPELLRRVQEAANAHRVSVAARVRQAMRQVTPEDFPASWRAGETGLWAHDSRFYGQRFMLRLDQTTATQLQHLVEQFEKPRAAIIHQLIVQATPEDFPESWQMAADEQLQHETRSGAGDHSMGKHRGASERIRIGSERPGLSWPSLAGASTR